MNSSERHQNVRPTLKATGCVNGTGRRMCLYICLALRLASSEPCQKPRHSFLTLILFFIHGWRETGRHPYTAETCRLSSTFLVLRAVTVYLVAMLCSLIHWHQYCGGVRWLIVARGTRLRSCLSPPRFTFYLLLLLSVSPRFLYLLCPWRRPFLRHGFALSRAYSYPCAVSCTLKLTALLYYETLHMHQITKCLASGQHISFRMSFRCMFVIFFQMYKIDSHCVVFYNPLSVVNPVWNGTRLNP